MRHSKPTHTAEFDPDYYVNLLEVLDAQAVRNAFSLADGKLLVSILPNGVESPTQEDFDKDPWAYYAITQFRYVVLDLATLKVTPVAELGEVSAGSATPLTIDNRVFLQI